ncbi:MAG TPA: hypothetical protein VIS48_05545 [Candidatus Kryptonia bacterium]
MSELVSTRISVEVAAIDKEIEIQTKTLNEMKNEVYLLVRDRSDGKNFTEEKRERLKFLQDKLREMGDAIKTLGTRKQETAIELKKKKSAKPAVLGTAHQSVVMEINGVRLALKQAYSNATFEVTKNEFIHTKNI